MAVHLRRRALPAPAGLCRLIRRAGDQGIFILLDPALPSRLHGAFPPGVAVTRLPLAEAVVQTRAFLRGNALSGTVDDAWVNP